MYGNLRICLPCLLPSFLLVLAIVLILIGLPVFQGIFLVELLKADSEITYIDNKSLVFSDTGCGNILYITSKFTIKRNCSYG